MTAFGSTISPTAMKQWFYSGTTNAAAKRQDEIWGYLNGLTWVRKNAAVDEEWASRRSAGMPWIDPEDVSLENHYYWTATFKDKTWILYPEREEMGIEMERWVLREWLSGVTPSGRLDSTLGDKWIAGWSLGIRPSSHYMAINKQYL